MIDSWKGKNTLFDSVSSPILFHTGAVHAHSAHYQVNELGVVDLLYTHIYACERAEHCITLIHYVGSYQST